MKKNRIAALLAALLILPAGLFAITGREIAENVENRDKGDSTHSMVQMDLIDKNGGVSTRVIEQFGKEDDQDRNRVIMVFHSPASVKNTRFLVLEKGEGRDDDKWIYLPAMQRVRRIASSEGSDSFMGTDFSYDDMSSREIDDYTYTLLREEEQGGTACYVIEILPKDPADSQYGRLISWVGKNDWVNRRADMYDKAGELEKVLTVERIESVQGFPTPIVTRMRNVQNGHSTLLTVKKFVYNDRFPASIFTTRFLQTGKP